MNGKSVLKSKTLIFNLLALAVGLAKIFGYADFQPDAEAQEAIDAVIVFVAAGVPLFNIGLRFITRQPITFGWLKAKQGVR